MSIKLKKFDSSFPYTQSISIRLTPFVQTTPKTTKQFISEIYYNRKLEEKIASIEPHSYVDLSFWNLIDHDISMIIRHIIINKQCTDLCLCGNKLTSQGITILALKLSNKSTLETLDLSYNRITDPGVYSLSQALLPNNYSSLKKLSLNKNGISNDGVQYLTDMLKLNQTLTELWLSDNEIGNEGVKQLADVLIHYNRTLKVLALSFNIFITDLTIDHLLQMFEHNKTLTKFLMNDCSLSEIGKMKLREKANRKIKFEIEI
jgi:Ran GTPase-activating protein (RanGAP) involved in mRNA processing and transport